MANEMDGPDEVKKTKFLFPAKLYCGQSLFDSRKESVIVDYNWGDNGAPKSFNDPNMKGTYKYRADLEYLTGKNGTLIRDEIRMIRPGFYLGRAYIQRAFGVNFAVYNKDVMKANQKVKEECWDGKGQTPELALK